MHVGLRLGKRQNDLKYNIDNTLKMKEEKLEIKVRIQLLWNEIRTSFSRFYWVTLSGKNDHRRDCIERDQVGVSN